MHNLWLQVKGSDLKQKLTSTGLEDWCRKPCWSKEQATLLSLGLDPKQINLKEIKYEIPTSCLKEYMKRVNLLDEYIKADKIITRWSINNTKDLEPSVFIRWAKNLDISFPPELETLIKKWDKDIDEEAENKDLKIERDKDKEEIAKLANECDKLRAEKIRLETLLNEKPLHGLEKKSLLRYAGTVTAIAYTTESYIGNTIKVSEIVKDFQDRGVEMDPKTIRKILETSNTELKDDIYASSSSIQK